MEGAKPEEAKDNLVVSPEKQNVEPRNIRLINTEISPKEVFWNNLMLLGFNSQEHEKLYGIPFHMDMFDQSNGKGMQVIFYFLFRLINRDKAKKVSMLQQSDLNLVYLVKLDAQQFFFSSF